MLSPRVLRELLVVYYYGTCGTMSCSQTFYTASCICRLFLPWTICRIGCYHLGTLGIPFRWKASIAPGSWGRFSSGFGNSPGRSLSCAWSDYECWSHSASPCHRSPSRSAGRRNLKEMSGDTLSPNHCWALEIGWLLWNSWTWVVSVSVHKLWGLWASSLCSRRSPSSRLQGNGQSSWLRGDCWYREWDWKFALS